MYSFLRDIFDIEFEYKNILNDIIKEKQIHLYYFKYTFGRYMKI